ncbi:hypothetical protein TX23_02300 [Pseudomonas paralactis]|uniref:Uncharacterized protein n=1 Tax=Pseudomonas paralactis TaxID=1615673 RepID=A0A0R3AXR2_9PSED|nr:hypothetical protein TX23_02300 [Pseudomonas paralactis]
MAHGGTSFFLFLVGSGYIDRPLGSRDALQENTSALLWLYTRDLQSFVSQRTAAAINGIFQQKKRSIAVRQARHRPQVVEQITQNAGCTMAFHANCTKMKIRKFYNLLILKDFFL